MTSAGHYTMMQKAGTPAPPAPAYWGLCFTAEEPNVVVNMTKIGSPPAVTLETSADGLNWTSFDAGAGTTPVTLANIGDTVYFRAGSSGNVQFAYAGTSDYLSFDFVGRVAASGDISSILNATQQVISFSANYVFAGLFRDCSSLTAAPELPATGLSSECYRLMFGSCTSLAQAPSILPALTLAASCYRSMFSYCSSLAAAPELLATILASSCCRNMFDYCSSLNYLSVKFPTWSTGSTSVWVRGVAASGTFRCPTALGTDSTITRGTGNCPVGWTVVNID